MLTLFKKCNSEWSFLFSGLLDTCISLLLLLAFCLCTNQHLVIPMHLSFCHRKMGSGMELLSHPFFKMKETKARNFRKALNLDLWQNNKTMQQEKWQGFLSWGDSILWSTPITTTDAFLVDENNPAMFNAKKWTYARCVYDGQRN